MQLLERDPAKRLCEPDQIKAHPFFKTIDWQKLAEQNVTPPYVPPVVRSPATFIISWCCLRTCMGLNILHRVQNDPMSVAMIDPSFTSERVRESPSGRMDPEMAMNAHLDDFTYVAPCAVQPTH